ncbi:flagellar assembly protein FliW [Uliginosibacterium sp. H1]|uniref:flagellar assembly protein FliW n=1 Tax=Uliginosibacterium sp. H1 TaxID=3114757 RepID=UPI002E186ACD|nr:flagellar assembly protein FliW [Uliginosibacterium sp. H1]
MKIDSPRFGSLEVEADKLINFPAGLPGLEDCKRFTLIEVGDKLPVLAVLQSADQPDVAFSVTSPDVLGLQYELTLNEEEEELLRTDTPDDITVLLILRNEETPHRRQGDLSVKANLMAPLVINTASRIGLQKIIGKLGCDVTLRAAE